MLKNNLILRVFSVLFLFALNSVEVSSFRRFLRKNKMVFSEKGEDLWFKQRLDHFNPADTRVWNQRYFVNDTFYKPGGPIFLEIGGEGEANPIWMKYGSWIKYAQKLNAMCFQLEHRYYGKSHPTSNLSLKNLKYLSSQQALADLAKFTSGMKEKYNFTSNKWVAFGGSYPGSLAAWYRMKYPHLVDIAVSSSAPLLAKLDFKEYLGVVTDSLKKTNPTCTNEIQSAVKSIDGLLKRRTGWLIIQNKFKLCDPLMGNNKKDVANLLETLAGNFDEVVQYNEDNRGFEGSKSANITIKTLCDIMTTNVTDSSAMERYAQVNDLMLNTFDQNCTDFKYAKMVKKMQNISWDSEVAGGERQWVYQTCAEFGFFQSSDLDGQPFGGDFPVEFSVLQCMNFYEPAFNKTFIENAIEWTNNYYGERDLQVTKVIFVNGNIDPWHALGITQQNETSNDNLVIFIDGTAHCANMYPDADSDLPQLKAARTAIFNKIVEWLK